MSSPQYQKYFLVVKEILKWQVITIGHVEGGVERWADLTSQVEENVSSCQAMIPRITDGSTETFWESGDE